MEECYADSSDEEEEEKLNINDSNSKPKIGSKSGKLIESISELDYDEPN